MSKFYKDWDGAASAIGKMEQLVQEGEISKDLEDALVIALDHRVQLNYDALAEAYDKASPEVQDLMEEIGVIIILGRQK